MDDRSSETEVDEDETLDVLTVEWRSLKVVVDMADSKL